MPKTVRYWTTGTRQPNFTAEGTPAELLAWVAYFPPGKEVPPLAVLNDVFRTGFRAGGFNGDTHWEPFELSPSDYEEVVRELVADESAGYRRVESPEWITTEWDWLAYVLWKRRGVPIEPYRKLLYKYKSLVDEQRAARASGRRVIALVKSLQANAVARGVARLLAKYEETR